MALPTLSEDIPPAGAVCSHHVERRAVFTCRKCGDFVCGDCKATAAKCMRCFDPDAGARAARAAAAAADPAQRLTSYGKASIGLAIVTFFFNPLFLSSLCAVAAGLTGASLLLFGKHRAAVPNRAAHVTLALIGAGLGVA